MYLRFFRNQIYAEYRKEIKFYQGILRQGSIVFDIGANVGDKSYIFAKLSNWVIILEPDQLNFEILSKRFASFKNIKIINAAVSHSNGKELFYVSEPGSPANTLSAKWSKVLNDPSLNRWSKSMKFNQGYLVQTITLDSLIDSYGSPHYIKIDVEGYEEQVLLSLSKKVPVLSFEANLPEFTNETLSCIKLLHQLSNKSSFNIINHEFDFFWPQNRSFFETAEWIERSNLRYFEVFCFS